MLFMAEFQLNPGSKNAAAEAFEKRGPNRNPGVKFRGAWIGAKTDVVYALVESESEALVTEAAESWREIGDCRIREVIDVDQY